MQQHSVPRAGPQAGGFSYGWPHAESGDDALIGSYGRAFDLIALGRPGRAPQNPRMPPLEAALFDSGRPALIVPPTAPAGLGHTVLVACNHSTEQARTYAFAIPLLRLAEQVTVLTVEGGTTPGPSGGEAALHLRRNGVKATALTVKPGPRSTGEANFRPTPTPGCDPPAQGP